VCLVVIHGDVVEDSSHQRFFQLILEMVVYPKLWRKWVMLPLMPTKNA